MTQAFVCHIGENLQNTNLYNKNGMSLEIIRLLQNVTLADAREN